MKNKRIMNAYDSINPSLSDKQRMLDAILAEASLEEAPRKTARRREPVVYTKVQSATPKRGSIWGTLAAAVALFVVAGFGLAFLMHRTPVDPSYAEPTTEVTVPEETVPEAYAETLAKYRKALDEGWDELTCYENGMNIQTPVDNEYDGLYYALYDLNDDGIDELIISEQPYQEDTDTGFIDIYTMKDGKEINVMSERALNTRFLCEGGFVKDFFIERGKAYDNFVGFWRLEVDTFVMEQKVYQLNGEWFSEGYRGVGAMITREEADEIVANYPPLKLDFIRLDAPAESSTVTAYDQIISKYVTALNENWSWEQCDAADISRQIMFDTTNKNDLGWCLLDIDNNGTEELLVSDGEYLFDLYTLMPTDAQPGHLICAADDHYMYCKDGTIELREHEDTVNTYWRWFHLSGIDLVEQDVVYFEAEKHQYYHGNSDRDLKPISEGEASKYMVNPEKAAMEITLTPFVEKQFPEVREPNYYYEPLIELYRKAIRENWNPGQCMENGISLMVGYYGELYDTLGHNQVDLNGDGNDELIITDGNNIYDLYTIVSDETVGPLRLVDATERQQYFLTTDGYIYAMGSGSAYVGYYSLYTVGQRALVLERGYMMDAEADPNNPWFYYDGVEKGDPCPTAEAAAITDAVHFAEISFIPFE